MSSDPTSTEIVRATDLRERVINRIAEIRNPELFKSYTAELGRYKRRLGKRKEITKEDGSPLLATKRRGFTKRVYDNATIFIPRPERPSPRAYGYWSYSRGGGFTTHAEVFGLLATPRYNRDIRPQRAAEYHEEMQAGRWRDLLTDPISITADGQVLNGQHRLAAAEGVDWEEAGNNPSFLVIWNADPGEALYADGSRRTQRDEKTVAARLLEKAP
jgi:hypothetical protein